MTRMFTNTDPSLRHGWLPLCRIGDVTAAPTSHKLLGVQWVAWRDDDGDIRVARDQCPHRLAPLSLGACEVGGLRCAYHGWRFDASGACTEIPALGRDANIPPRARLTVPAGVVCSHGMVFIAIDEPVSAVPTLTAHDDPTFMAGDLPVLTTRGGAALLADNFLDMAHFPFVHAGTFGANEVREVPPYEVTRREFGFDAVYEHDFANREDEAVQRGERPLIQRRRLTYRYDAPFHLVLDIEFLDAGGSNIIGFFLAPEDDETVRVYSTLWRNDVGHSVERMAEAIDFEMAVVAEDLALQSNYEHLGLDLDVTREVHTRADKTTLEMRRILVDFVREADRRSGRAGEI